MNLCGNPFDFFLAFLGGVLLSFTPCVYPLVPVSAGYIGIKSNGSKLKGLILSLVYVTGIALTYSGLGLVASLSGSLFGSFSANPITHIIVGLVICGFGLAMSGLFHMPIPNLVKPSAPKGNGYLAVLVLGLTSGLVISPCVTPVLASILAYLATRKNIFYGTALLFSFAYGMGLLIILVSTFSSILFGLPKLGEKTAYVKKIFAFILIAAGVYFIFTATKRL
jgi:thiol:disulfide interchange protein DsbD